MALPLPITPSFRLDGRCALVTGGSKGIGLAAAAALVQAGAHLTLIARNAADKKIEMRVELVGENVSKLKIRVGVFGDEAQSLAILEKVKSNL